MHVLAVSLLSEILGSTRSATLGDRLLGRDQGPRAVTMADGMLLVRAERVSTGDVLSSTIQLEVASLADDILGSRWLSGLRIFSALLSLLDPGIRAHCALGGATTRVPPASLSRFAIQRTTHRGAPLSRVQRCQFAEVAGRKAGRR